MTMQKIESAVYMCLHDEDYCEQCDVDEDGFLISCRRAEDIMDSVKEFCGLSPASKLDRAAELIGEAEGELLSSPDTALLARRLETVRDELRIIKQELENA